MNHSEREQYIIERYLAGEAEMILLFVQWCRNHELDPLVVYQEAHANQKLPDKLVEINQDLTESNEQTKIKTSLLLEVLQVYGNDDLAFVVANYENQKQK